MRALEESFAKATAAMIEEESRAAEAAAAGAGAGADTSDSEAVPLAVASDKTSSAFAASPSEARVSGSGKWARRGSGEYPTGSAQPPPSRRPSGEYAVTPPVRRASGEYSVPPARRGSGEYPSAQAQTPPQAPQAPPQAPPARPASGSRLVQKMLSKNLRSDRTAKAREHFEEAGRQAQACQWVTAMHNYQLAATLVPDNTEYAAKLKEARKRAAEVQAAGHARRAEFEERAGRFDAAARCWQEAIALHPTSSFCVKAVEMFLQIRELNKAFEYGIKAVELDSANASAYLALAFVYRERKQLIDARRAVERALELDAKHKEAKELLRQLEKLG